MDPCYVRGTLGLALWLAGSWFLNHASTAGKDASNEVPRFQREIPEIPCASDGNEQAKSEVPEIPGEVR